jgi:hypothetical protein
MEVFARTKKSCFAQQVLQSVIQQSDKRPRYTQLVHAVIAHKTSFSIDEIFFILLSQFGVGSVSDRQVRIQIQSIFSTHALKLGCQMVCLSSNQKSQFGKKI